MATGTTLVGMEQPGPILVTLATGTATLVGMEQPGQAIPTTKTLAMLTTAATTTTTTTVGRMVQTFHIHLKF